MAADIGRHSLAQRYYIQTLNLAMSAGDRCYAANVLSHMSRLTVQIGHGALTENDRLRHARQAVALARAGHSVTAAAASPRLSSLLHAVEARGNALLGDTNATRAAVLEAQRCNERVQADNEPTWLGFYTEAELATDLGRCLRDVGELEQADRLITQAMDDYEPWRVRSRCFVLTDLAASRLAARDFEHAAALGREAVRTAARVSSTRTVDRLRTLQRQVRPLRPSSPQLGELDDRITDLRTRHRTRQDEDFTT